MLENASRLHARPSATPELLSPPREVGRNQHLVTRGSTLCLEVPGTIGSEVESKKTQGLWWNCASDASI